MNILHLIAGNLKGGASRGALNLHHGLLKENIDSFVLTDSSFLYNIPNTDTICDNLYKKFFHRLNKRISHFPVTLYPNRTNYLFNTAFAGIDFTKHKYYRNADIIHLHWINGMVSLRMLRKINKPIVWTIRDMWPITGGCHYSMECTRYTNGCGRCPQLGSQSNFDLSRLVIELKQHILPRDIHYVTLSTWLKNCASKSYLTNDSSISVIGNCIDTNEFIPVKKYIAKEALNLPRDKKIILIGAQNIKHYYKGFNLFIDAIKHLDNEKIHILIFGETQNLDGIGSTKYTSLGFLSDMISIMIAYSAADVFVAPSTMEAFGKTIIESMSCGTPVVCFDNTGPGEIIKHKITGYKAKDFDSRSLSNGIEWILSLDKKVTTKMSQFCRKEIIEKYDKKIISKKYIDLYKEVLNN